MDFTLTQRQDTPAIGYAFVTTPHSPEIGAAWGRVHQNGDFDRLMAKSARLENFGLCIMDPTLPEGSFRYMIAFDHDVSKPADPDMTEYTIKGGAYAVFRSPTMDEISGTFRYIYQEWFKTADYEYDADRPADFELYSMGEGDVTCDVCVPVRKKG